MDTNVYLQLVSNEIDDLGTYTDGMTVNCHQHGELTSYGYDEYIPWHDIEELVDEHLHSFHFA